MVLRCAIDTRVDIVTADSEAAAIADVIGRAFASRTPPDLPLLSAVAAPIPHARLAELAGQVIVPTPPVVPPKIHVVGILQIAQMYRSTVITDSAAAREKLIDFFAHYGIEIDFTVARAVATAQAGS